MARSLTARAGQVAELKDCLRNLKQLLEMKLHADTQFGAMRTNIEEMVQALEGVKEAIRTRQRADYPNVRSGSGTAGVAAPGLTHSLPRRRP